MGPCIGMPIYFINVAFMVRTMPPETSLIKYVPLARLLPPKTTECVPSVTMPFVSVAISDPSIEYTFKVT
jgi:hypothetical protein